MNASVSNYFSIFKQYVKCFPFLSMFRFMSYSQNFEDRLIWNLLKDQSKLGTYIDIGSGHPIWGSNTYLFYRKGWRGVLIDPIKRNITLSKIVRLRDLSYQKIIANKCEEITFYEFNPYEYSTSSYDVYLERVNSGLTLKKRTEIESIRLENILSKIEINYPLILSIDTEGTEFEILQSFNIAKWKPEVICVEERGNPLFAKTNIKEFLEANGYKLVAYTGLSSIYLCEI